LGEFRPGDPLPSERTLMESYGVGRPAVREALQQLERDGIIVITHGERARIVVPTADQLIRQIANGANHLLRIRPDSLDHLKDARLFLELALVRRAAERADPEGMAQLRRRLEEHVHALQNLAEFLPIFPAIIEAMFGWLGAYYRHLVRVPGAENLTIAPAHPGRDRRPRPRRRRGRHARAPDPRERAVPAARTAGGAAARPARPWTISPLHRPYRDRSRP
jgi:GntR family transcriptional regulator, sialic acid-inducible nan operon repressor